MAGDNNLRNLRKGIPPHKRVTLGTGDNSITVMVVLLQADVIRMIEEETEEYCQSNKEKVNNKVRNQFYNMLLCRYCMRDIDDPTYSTYVTEDVNEVGEFMDLEDIKQVCKAYQELMVNKAPKLEMLKEEDYEEIKKVLETTKLSDLSTVSLVHLKYFHQTIASEA